MRMIFKRHGFEVWEHGYGSQRLYQVYDRTNRLDITNSYQDAIITAWWHAELSTMTTQERLEAEAEAQAIGMSKYLDTHCPDWSEDITSHDADFLVIRATVAERMVRSAA